MLAQT